MSRLDIKTPDQAQMMVDQLYHDMERRIAASPPGLCPVDMAMNFLNLCHAQTCGKCVPCRVGLGQLSILLADVLDGRAKPRHMEFIEETAQSIAYNADCAKPLRPLKCDPPRQFSSHHFEDNTIFPPLLTPFFFLHVAFQTLKPLLCYLIIRMPVHNNT